MGWESTGEPRQEFGWGVALISFVVPVFGVLYAIARFARNAAGPAIACLLCAAAGVGAWELLAQTWT